jgi:Ca2+-binding RTX toxin-like protein
MDGFGDGDTYYTDGDDIIIELAGNGGTDEVRATASYRLTPGAYVERLIAFNGGTDTIDLTGNEVGQIIIGNNAQNGLDGGGGADILSGRGGNDFYFVDTDDVIQEEQLGQGFDNVMARNHYTLGGGVSAEVLSTANHSGTDNINLTGNGVGQVIIGNAGINYIDGSDGNDRLAGFGNADHFSFTYALGNNNIDVIADFDADDTIRLENFVFVGLPTGALNPNAFVLGTAAADADDRIIYDAATGRVYFDLDGTGPGNMLHFVTLENHFALTASDFEVI